MSDYLKPLPEPSALTQPFWDAAKSGGLSIQKCDGCGRYRFYPTPICASCGSHDYTWTAVSGRGTVYSWIVIRRAIDPVWQADVPFVVAIVELDEQKGLLMPGTLTDVDVKAVDAGMPVEVWFDPVSDRISLPRWRPALRH